MLFGSGLGIHRVEARSRNTWIRLEPQMPIFQELVEGQVSQEGVGNSGMLKLALANSC